MTPEVFEQRVAALTSRQEANTTALIEEYRKDLAEVQSAALRYVRAGGEHGLRARSVMTQLGETAVESLSSTVVAQKPIPDSSLLIDLVKGAGFAEAAVVSHLKVALQDTRTIPQAPALRVLEEVGPPSRVCDEAYCALRRIPRAESFLQHLMETRHFLSLPDKAKNREIESWLKTGSFTRFLDDVDVEDE